MQCECGTNQQGVYLNIPDLGRLWMRAESILSITREPSRISLHPSDFARIRFKPDIPEILISWHESMYSVCR
jgi:hypothetical protein